MTVARNAKAKRRPTQDGAAISDEELARRAQDGCREAFAELVGRYEQRLLNFLVRRTGHLQDAEDLLQDTFARAYDRIGSYDSSWRFATWLYTIGTRLTASFYRKARSVSLPENLDLPSTGPDPHVSVSQREQKDNLWAIAAQTLSEKQYLAVWLRYVEGMAVKDISRVMDKTQSHVKVILFRARSALAKRLATGEAGSVRLRRETLAASRAVSTGPTEVS